MERFRYLGIRMDRLFREIRIFAESGNNFFVHKLSGDDRASFLKNVLNVPVVGAGRKGWVLIGP